MAKRKSVQVNPDDSLIPRLLVYRDDEVTNSFFRDANDAINAAFAAETLGLCYRLDAYQGPVDDITTQREWRLTAWRQATSDAVMLRDKD